MGNRTKTSTDEGKDEDGGINEPGQQLTARCEAEQVTLTSLSCLQQQCQSVEGDMVVSSVRSVVPNRKFAPEHHSSGCIQSSNPSHHNSHLYLALAYPPKVPQSKPGPS